MSGSKPGKAARGADLCAAILSHVFWVGRAPWMPGTFGSMAGLLLAWGTVTLYGVMALIPGTVAVTIVGVWAAHRHAARLGEQDPQEIVIDEVAGQFLTCLLLAPQSWWEWLTAFFVFRLFDIVKPWPVSWIDRNCKGGVGIMGDDIAAAVPAFLLGWGIQEGGRWLAGA